MISNHTDNSALFDVVLSYLYLLYKGEGKGLKDLIDWYVKAWTNITLQELNSEKQLVDVVHWHNMTMQCILGAYLSERFR